MKRVFFCLLFLVLVSIMSIAVHGQQHVSDNKRGATKINSGGIKLNFSAPLRETDNNKEVVDFCNAFAISNTVTYNLDGSIDREVVYLGPSGRNDDAARIIHKHFGKPQVDMQTGNQEDKLERSTNDLWSYQEFNDGIWQYPFNTVYFGKGINWKYTQKVFHNKKEVLSETYNVLGQVGHVAGVQKPFYILEKPLYFKAEGNRAEEREVSYILAENFSANASEVGDLKPWWGRLFSQKDSSVLNKLSDVDNICRADRLPFLLNSQNGKFSITPLLSAKGLHISDPEETKKLMAEAVIIIISLIIIIIIFFLRYRRKK